MRRSTLLLAVLALGCGDPSMTTPDDAAVPLGDAGPAVDASPSTDAGPTPIDAGSTAIDAGAPSVDAGTIACGAQPAGASMEEHAIRHGGLDRAYIVHAPSSYDASTPIPVVLGFNGRDGSPEGFEEQTRLSEAAERHGFLLVYPRGSGGGSWNGGACCGSAASDDVDDVGFVGAMLDDLEARYCVDADRVFATGLSNGGFMSHRVGCELADRVAAIAPVAGMKLVDDCAPSRPLSVLHMHGTADYIVPYGGNRFIGFPSVEDSTADWRAALGCEGEGEETFSDSDVSCLTWSCAAGQEVELCTVQYGGHTWPGGHVRAAGGYTTENLDANDHMWAFFSRHGR